MSMKYYLKQVAYVTPALYEDGIIQLDGYGKPLYGGAYSTKVRKEERQEEIQSAGWMREKGAKMVSIIQYYTFAPVEVGDMIDGRMVVAREIYVNGLGVDEGRRCFT